MPKVFQARIKHSVTGKTIAKTTLDFAFFANMDETTALSSPKGIDRQYSTELQFTRADGKGVASGEFIVTAQDVTPPPVTPEPKKAREERAAAEGVLGTPVGSPTHSSSASSLGPDEDVVELSDGEVAETYAADKNTDLDSSDSKADGDVPDVDNILKESGTQATKSFASQPPSEQPSHVEQDLEGFDEVDGGVKDAHEKPAEEVSLWASVSRMFTSPEAKTDPPQAQPTPNEPDTSFVENFGNETVDVFAPQSPIPIDKLSPAESPNESPVRESSERRRDPVSQLMGMSPEDASRMRWAKAAAALGIAPPSSPAGVDGDESLPGTNNSKAKKRSMLGLYTSPSKTSAKEETGASRFQVVAKKIALAGRMGASISDGSECGTGTSLLDELNAVPDFATVAKEESNLNETELTKIQKIAVQDAVEALRQMDIFGEDGDKENAIGNAFETALYERTASYELEWENKIEMVNKTNQELKLEKEMAEEALAMFDEEIASDDVEDTTCKQSVDAIEDTEQPTEAGKQSGGTSEDTDVTPSQQAGKQSGGSTSTDASQSQKSNSKTSNKKSMQASSPVKVLRSPKASPPGSPSHLFQRAAQVSKLEEEVERLTLQTQKLELEALAEKGIAKKLKEEVKVAQDSLRSERLNIEKDLEKRVRQKTKRLEDDHALMVTTVTSLTEERDLSRQNASQEATTALQTSLAELDLVIKERDTSREEAGVLKGKLEELGSKLEESVSEVTALKEQLNQHRESSARSEGEHTAHLNDITQNLETTKTLLKEADTLIATMRDSAAEAEKTKEKDAKENEENISGLNSKLKSVTKDLDVAKHRAKSWEETSTSHKIEIEGLKSSLEKSEKDGNKASKKLEKDSEKKAKEFTATIDGLKLEVERVTKNLDRNTSVNAELEERCEAAEQTLASAKMKHIESEAVTSKLLKEAKDALSIANQELVDFKENASETLNALKVETEREFSKVHNELDRVTKDFESKKQVIDAARDRATSAEASVASAKVEAKQAVGKMEKARLEVKGFEELVSKHKLEKETAEETLRKERESFGAEIESLKSQLEQALRDASLTIDPEQLVEAEQTIGRVMEEKEEAELSSKVATRDLEKLKEEMNNKWNDTLLKAEAVRETHRVALDNALRKYETLRDVEQELVEWRRRCVEAESLLDAKSAEKERDVSVSVSNVESMFLKKNDALQSLLRDERRAVAVSKEKIEMLRNDVHASKQALQNARDESFALKNALAAEESRRESAEQKTEELLELSSKKSDEALESVASANTRLRDTELRLQETTENASVLSSQLAEQITLTQEAQKVRDVGSPRRPHSRSQSPRRSQSPGCRSPRTSQGQKNPFGGLARHAWKDDVERGDNVDTENCSFETKLFDARREASDTRSELAELTNTVEELKVRVDVSEAKASAAEAAKKDSETSRFEMSRQLAAAEAKALEEASNAASAVADADKYKRQASDALHEKEMLEASSSQQLANANETIEHTRSRLAEARGRLARVSKGGDSAKDDSIRGGTFFLGFDEIDESENNQAYPSRESSFANQWDPKSPARKSLPNADTAGWNYGAKDARGNAGAGRASTLLLPPQSPRRSESSITASLTSPAAVASAIAAAAITSVNGKDSTVKRHSACKPDFSSLSKHHWSSPSREYVKSRSGAAAFDTPFAKAKPEAVVMAAADAAVEIKRLREILDAREKEMRRVQRAAKDSRNASRVAANEATKEADRRHAIETKRLRDTLTETDSKLLQTRAELKALTVKAAKADSESRKLRRSQQSAAEEVKLTVQRESASAARVATTRAIEAEADRARHVSDARRKAEMATVEARRLQDALVQTRVSLDASEEERFELRRALEAHVGALVEAKVDEAERVGELAALRETVDDIRNKYDAAARKVVELEAKETRRLSDERFVQLVGGGAYSYRTTPRSSVGAGSEYLGDSSYPRINTGRISRGKSVNSVPQSPQGARASLASPTGTKQSPWSPTRANGQRSSFGSVARHAATAVESDPALAQAHSAFMEKIDVD